MKSDFVTKRSLGNCFFWHQPLVVLWGTAPFGTISVQTAKAETLSPKVCETTCIIPTNKWNDFCCCVLNLLLTFPCCLPPTPSGLADSQASDVWWNTSSIGICSSVLWWNLACLRLTSSVRQDKHRGNRSLVITYCSVLWFYAHTKSLVQM